MASLKDLSARIAKDLLSPVADTMWKGVQSFNTLGNYVGSQAQKLIPDKHKVLADLQVNAPSSQDYYNILNAGLTGVGAVYGGPAAVAKRVLGGTAVGAGVGGVAGALTTGDLFSGALSGAGQGIASSLRFAPVGAITNPLLSGALSKLNLPTSIAPFGQGIANVAEGFAFAKGTGDKYTPLNAAIDFGIGTLTKPFTPATKIKPGQPIARDVYSNNEYTGMSKQSGPGVEGGKLTYGGAGEGEYVSPKINLMEQKKMLAKSAIQLEKIANRAEGVEKLSLIENYNKVLGELEQVNTQIRNLGIDPTTGKSLVSQVTKNLDKNQVFDETTAKVAANLVKEFKQGSLSIDGTDMAMKILQRDLKIPGKEVMKLSPAQMMDEIISNMTTNQRAAYIDVPTRAGLVPEQEQATNILKRVGILDDTGKPNVGLKIKETQTMQDVTDPKVVKLLDAALQTEQEGGTLLKGVRQAPQRSLIGRQNLVSDSLDKSIPQGKGELNIENLNTSGPGMAAIKRTNKGIVPTVIGNKQVIKAAETATGSKNAITDQQMEKLIAQQLKNRQKVVDLSETYNQAVKNGASIQEKAKILLEISDQSKVARQGGTFAGRFLQAQNILADTSASPMQRIFALLDNAGVDQRKYIKEAVNVDFNNPLQVVTFYRKFVPAKLGEILTEYRYTNMLSSPLTHIINTASNLLQSAPVAAIEKTITGGLDWAASKLTGRERQYYASAGIDYLSGYAKALPEATKKFWNTLSGKELSIRPDYEYIPVNPSGAGKWYTTALRGLEASDQFFKTLVRGGVTEELSRGPQKRSLEEIARLAENEATYRLFRQKFDPSGELGQGIVLRAWDSWNSAIQNLRRAPGGNWILPFLQTPTNILKQGFEYSPLGATTAIGAAKPLEQISKSLIGSAVFTMAYSLAKSGLVSWEAPTGGTERDLYYAAGLQPYSVKVGDKWVSYSKLGPLAYPIAMAAALSNAERYNPDASRMEQLSMGIGGILQFFGDQSYVKSIGDVVEAVKEGKEGFLNKVVQGEAANLAGQLVPLRSALGWITRMIDPVYRKANTFGEKITRDIPGMSQNLEPYTDLSGNPSTRDFPIINSFFPYRISQEKQPAADLYNAYEEAKIQRGVEKRADDKFSSGNEQQSGNFYRYIDEKGTLQKIQLDWTPPKLELTGNSELDKKIKSEYSSKINKRANDIHDLYLQKQLTVEQADAELKKLTDMKNETKATAKPKKVSVPRAKITLSSPKLKGSNIKRSSFKTKTPPKLKMSRPKTTYLKVSNTKKVPAIKLKPYRNTLATGTTKLA